MDGLCNGIRGKQLSQCLSLVMIIYIKKMGKMFGLVKNFIVCPNTTVYMYMYDTDLVK